VKHWHVYDTTGEVMCVDAEDWQFSTADSTAFFFNRGDPDWQFIATFNWSNVVCVREEEDDDEDEGSSPLPDWVPDVVLN